MASDSTPINKRLGDLCERYKPLKVVDIAQKLSHVTKPLSRFARSITPSVTSSVQKTNKDRTREGIQSMGKCNLNLLQGMRHKSLMIVLYE